MAMAMATATATATGWHGNPFPTINSMNNKQHANNLIHTYIHTQSIIPFFDFVGR
jgi:hypothetical protein